MGNKENYIDVNSNEVFDLIKLEANEINTKLEKKSSFKRKKKV